MRGPGHVYAIEASDIADVAERVFEVNGVSDRITLAARLVRAHRSAGAERDVLVSEIIGNEPLDEEILETTLDARQRLLAPGARLVPHALTLLARPVLIPEGGPAPAGDRAPGMPSAGGGCTTWTSSPCSTPPGRVSIHTPIEAEVAAAWPPVGPPVVLAELDLTSFEDASVSASADLVIDAPGAVNAVAVTFRADLYGTVAHTLDPWRWPTSSWATSVCVLPDALHVGPGAVLRVHYSRRAQGAPDGLTCEVVEP